MSKILNIEEVDNVNFNDDDYHYYDGIKIETEDEEIYFVIDNDQQCCENWGKYLYTPEDVKEYIGADYFGYDTETSNAMMECLKEEYIYYPSDVCFLNIHTSKGDIDYAVYNSHNGYYSHAVVLSIKNKKTNETKNVIDDYL